jgi:hypothetical protein
MTRLAASALVATMIAVPAPPPFESVRARRAQKVAERFPLGDAA